MADRFKNKKLILYIASAVILVALVTLFILHMALKPRQEKKADGDLSKEIISVSPNAKRVMENERFVLDLNEDTMAIELTDKETGITTSSSQDYNEGNAIWNGFCQSGVTVEFYTGASTVTAMAPVASEDVSREIEYLDDGFNAAIKYNKYDFSMVISVRLTEDGLTVAVPGNSIKEGDSFFAGSIWLYPMLGSTYLGEKEGYMVIPEGVGATIDLSDNNGKYRNPYSKRIYGDNVGTDAAKTNSYGTPTATEEEEITLPVFGMVYEDSAYGFLGIVTEGEYNARIVAYPNGVTTPYNFVTSQFMVRDIYTKQTAKVTGVPTFETKGDIRDLGIKYIFTEGDDADYIGLATAYRNYLLKENKLIKGEDAFKIKLDVLGSDSAKWFVFDTVVPMTTVEDLRKITEDLVESGIKDLEIVYSGFEDGGITASYGDVPGFEGKLGSKKEIAELKEALNKDGIRLLLKKDFLLANPGRLYNTTKDIVKGIGQVIVEIPTYQKLYEKLYYLTPVKTEELIEEFSKKYLKVSSDVAIAGISDTLFSYYSAGATYERGEVADAYHDMLSNREFDVTAFESPAAYLFDCVDEYFEMSMTTSNYNFIKEEIPFVPTVIKGLIPYYGTAVNFEANETDYFLKLIEYGAYPSFLVTEESPMKLRNTNSSYIYTSEYEALKPKILKYEAEIGGVLKKVEGAAIVEHEVVYDGVKRILYDNGIEIYVNYSDSEYVSGEVHVPGKGYFVREVRE